MNTAKRLFKIEGVQQREVLRRCNHTPEEHLAMARPNEGCRRCGGTGIVQGEAFIEDCNCISSCCKWITEVQKLIPWCLTHDKPAVVAENGDGTFSVEDHDLDTSCNISYDAAWRTVQVRGKGIAGIRCPEKSGGA